MAMDVEEEEDAGNGWIMTFADLMSLLMCFFVLLLSFSELDIQKYKQVAGSMKNAFGIQREVKSDVVPKGTSIIAEEFSPGKPDPDVLIKQMRQDTTDDYKENLDFDSVNISEQAKELAEFLEQTLESEIQEGTLEVILEDHKVSIRIHEKDSFPSASARLNTEFFPVLDKIINVLNESTAQVIVGGHSDSLPISTERYTSNWTLSAERAAVVINYMVAERLNDITRVELRAFADLRPIVPNDSEVNHAKNRRVEIVVDFSEQNRPPEEVSVDLSNREVW